MRKLSRLLGVLAVLALLAAACGSDGGDSDTGAAATTETDADSGDDSDAGDSEEEAMEDEDEAPAAMLTDVGVDDETIRLGLLTDLTGPFAPLTVPITDGTEAYWEWVNSQGGVAGRQVELDIFDTAYDLEAHGQFFEQVADTGDEGVVMIQTSTGSPHTASIRDDVTDLPPVSYTHLTLPTNREV